MSNAFNIPKIPNIKTAIEEINKDGMRILEGLDSLNIIELLVLYHRKVENYYDELIKYKENTEVRDKLRREELKVNLNDFNIIKYTIVRIYMGITQIRKMNDFKNYEAYFTILKEFEDLVTKALFFIDRRKGMRLEDYNKDINNMLIELKNFKDTRLSPHKIFLLRILRAKDTGTLPLYIQPPKDNLPPPTNTGSRLQMLSAKVAAQPPQPQAHIVPAVLRKNMREYRKAQEVAQAAQEVAQAGISPRHRQSAKAAAGLRPASGAPRNRGIVPSDTPLSPPPYSQRPPTLYRRTSAAAAAASSNLPPTIIAQPPAYRPPIKLGKETMEGKYVRGVYPSHLLPNNVVVVDKLNISPPVLSARSHSFKSNSPDNDKKPEFDIEGDVRNPPEVYLIDNKNDGLCFLNAIFDYLLYSGKLPTMYERLLAIEELILENYGMDTNILKIKKTALSLIGVGEGTYDLSVKKLIPVSQAREIYYIKQNEKGQLIRLIGDEGLRFKDSNNKVEHLGHPEGKKTYEDQRKNFVISMKYVLALYILSYGKKKFIDMIVFTLTAETSHIEWTENLRTTFKGNYEGNLEGFVYEYVLEYLINKNFFVNHSLIVMFKKILFKKIKDAKGKNIPRFWLEIATIFMNYGMARVPRKDEYPDLRTFTDEKGNRTFERVLNKYRFKASGATQSNKYIHTDKYDNYISLLCDNNRTHYLLFLLKKEIKYDVFGLSRGGGKPKRPKTVSKSKSPSKPKTVSKPKRPKTAK